VPTCTCSYQNQTSLGLIHMPENEMWTFTGSSNPTALGRGSVASISPDELVGVDS
jgi:hypothetical protein